MRRDFFSTSVARPPIHTEEAMSVPVEVPAVLKPMHTPAWARRGRRDGNRQDRLQMLLVSKHNACVAWLTGAQKQACPAQLGADLPIP